MLRWNAARGALAAGVLVLLVSCTDGSSGGSTASKSTTTAAPTRSGPCVDLDLVALDRAVGKNTDVAEDGADHCVLRPAGTNVRVEVDQLETDAVPDDLDDIVRSGGSDPAKLEPWPREEVEGGEAAIWLDDPQTKGQLGELYGVEQGRLVRLTVTVPEGYRRTTRSIGEATWPIVAADLAKPKSG